jgi:tRNA/rRNA methyltransferase
MPLRNIRIVLVQPRGGANVGAAARAMKNMGLDDLVLVRPAIVRQFWSKAMAVHAEEVLSRARRYDALGDAVADCGLVVGTTCRGGLYRRAAEAPRAAAPRIVAAARSNRVALVFGPEDHGLDNEDLKLCQQLITIPTSPGYASLNLAQAVVVCAYELRLAAGADATTTPVLATAERVEFMFQRLQAAFLSIGFLHGDNPDHIMFAFRRVLGRAQLEEPDVQIWLGLARQIEWFGRGGWRTMAERHERGPGALPAADGETIPVAAGPASVRGVD